MTQEEVIFKRPESALQNLKDLVGLERFGFVFGIFEGVIKRDRRTSPHYKTTYACCKYAVQGTKTRKKKEKLPVLPFMIKSDGSRDDAMRCQHSCTRRITYENTHVPTIRSANRIGSFGFTKNNDPSVNLMPMTTTIAEPEANVIDKKVAYTTITLLLLLL